jgi:hypothetical protein
MLRETDSLESGIIQEVGTLEALKEQVLARQFGLADLELSMYIRVAYDSFA